MNLLKLAIMLIALLLEGAFPSSAFGQQYGWPDQPKQPDQPDPTAKDAPPGVTCLECQVCVDCKDCPLDSDESQTKLEDQPELVEQPDSGCTDCKPCKACKPCIYKKKPRYTRPPRYTPPALKTEPAVPEVKPPCECSTGSCSCEDLNSAAKALKEAAEALNKAKETQDEKLIKLAERLIVLAESLGADVKGLRSDFQLLIKRTEMFNSDNNSIGRLLGGVSLTGHLTIDTPRDLDSIEVLTIGGFARYVTNYWIGFQFSGALGQWFVEDTNVWTANARLELLVEVEYYFTFFIGGQASYFQAPTEGETSYILGTIDVGIKVRIGDNFELAPSFGGPYFDQRPEHKGFWLGVSLSYVWDKKHKDDEEDDDDE